MTKVRELKNFPQKMEYGKRIVEARTPYTNGYNQALQEIGDLDIPEQERLDKTFLTIVLRGFDNGVLVKYELEGKIKLDDLATAICSHFSAPKREVDEENKEELKKAIESGKSELSRLESEDIRADWHEELAILVNFCDNILAQAIKQSLESEDL